jgi:hypothetical protein
MAEPPDPAERLLQLHCRLVAGDETTSRELCQLLLEPLVQRVAGCFQRGTDEHHIHTAVADVLLKYIADPSRFDPEAGAPLDRFLQLAAQRDVLNLLRGDIRRRTREQKAAASRPEGNVELDPVAGNIFQEELARRQRENARLLALLDDPVDRAILELRLQGVKDSAAYARALGITHLPPTEQRRRVHRAKNRIIAFFRRRGITI